MCRQVALASVFLLWCSCLSTLVAAYEGSVVPMGGSLLRLLNRQTTECPNYSDCTCESWGMSCTVSDWSWFECSDFPGSCDNSTSTYATSVSTRYPPSISTDIQHRLTSTSSHTTRTTSQTNYKIAPTISKPKQSSTPTSASSSPPKPSGQSYGVYMGYYVYTGGGGYPVTDYFWRFWQNKGTNPPNYCTSQDISSTQDSGFFAGNSPAYPGSSITFRVPDAGNRECTWKPNGDYGLGSGGPGSLSCKGGPSNVWCVEVKDQKEAVCGADYNPRVDPIAQCTWQDPS